MYPNLFLRTFWQMDLRPQIFVAMSFDDAYTKRFEDVIEPAIRSIRVKGVPLEPYRVDFSRSGDSILTDIMDGIAHCQMFLADVSVIGRDSKTGQAYRNSNVMYEVGLALACRQSTEILLVRDDRDKFLFDVSTIPHVTIDFTNTAGAIETLRHALDERLRERCLLGDARVKRAAASLTDDEVRIIKEMGGKHPASTFHFDHEGPNLHGMILLSRLFDKQLIKLIHISPSGRGEYMWTPLGWKVVELVHGF